MEPDDDPLWYDRVESDDSIGALEMALIAAFAVAEFFHATVMALSRIFILRGSFPFI